MSTKVYSLGWVYGVNSAPYFVVLDLALTICCICEVDFLSRFCSYSPEGQNAELLLVDTLFHADELRRE